MESYCLKCRRGTENVDPKVSRTSNSKIMISSKCAVRDSKKSRFIKKSGSKRTIK